MKASALSINKVEFVHINVEANSNFQGEKSPELHQLDFDFDGITFKRRMSLQYDKDKSDDPRSFLFGLNIILSRDDDDVANPLLPYNVDVKAVAYMRYNADKLTGMERFRAIRATGYSVLYGAIREMVSNLTARGPNGMWSFPAADFNLAAHEEAQRDEARRQEHLQQQTKIIEKKSPRRVKKVKPDA
ncbi:hypothetical protein [Pseudomonas sp. 5P_5.1_Bac1]|uniref:hypothetical protein n=1 Tax=Pseudomonas sp. 5P_5.1_Bac1 TaxID=2971616 RepID=UPI0021C99142|nr:hypothetical protein [Pseudomonas sp. 5P_5.1_Bac1]MCU1722400.1 hypothetical protein [Pseudomonas sp. 5P_5.1_Bac1]